MEWPFFDLRLTCDDVLLRGVTDAPEPRNGRPVLLACTPGELHSLPLSALAHIPMSGRRSVEQR